MLGFLLSTNTFCCEAPSEKIFDNGEARTESTSTNGEARTESTAANGAAQTESTATNGAARSESTAANGAARSENTATSGKAQPITGKAQNKIYPKKRNSCRPTRAERRFRQQKAGKNATLRAVEFDLRHKNATLLTVEAAFCGKMLQKVILHLQGCRGFPAPP